MALEAQPIISPAPGHEDGAAPPQAPPLVWSSKAPPLFQEGAPYPPPLLIRDSYNQTLPQPPPRKIKRPKRRYRSEEPTSIMNAIKLRPRQVLCDKCKGVVSSGGPREARRGPLDRRRPAEGPISLELKRLRNDDKGGRSERRSSSGIRVTSSSRLRAAPSSSSSGHLRLKLNPKGSDGSKPRQVLKNLTCRSAPPRPKDQNQDHDRPKAVTRAAALQNHNQKVHFTRRLQHLSGAAGPDAALPPRMRLKPQRYRTDEAPCPAPKPKPEQTPPLAPPSPCRVGVGMETEEACPPEEEGPQQQGGEEPPLSSPPSECSSTETFDLAPPGDQPSSSSSPQGEEDEEDKRRHRPSSATPSSVFSKSVSKVLLPDGRTVCVGDIVWAKIYGFPWWPARVLAITVARRGDTGLAVRQEARVSWFGSPTTSFLPLAQLSPFLETFQSRFDRKRKGPYRRAIAEAASAAKQLTPEVRALLTQFET